MFREPKVRVFASQFFPFIHLLLTIAGTVPSSRYWYLLYGLFCFNLRVLPNLMSVTSGPLFVNPIPNKVRLFFLFPFPCPVTNSTDQRNQYYFLLMVYMTVVYEILSGSNDDNQGRLCWGSCCLIVLYHSDAAPRRAMPTETSWWHTWYPTTRWDGSRWTRCPGRGLPPRGLSEAGRCPRPPIRVTGEPPAPRLRHNCPSGCAEPWWLWTFGCALSSFVI